MIFRTLQVTPLNFPRLNTHLFSPSNSKFPIPRTVPQDPPNWKAAESMALRTLCRILQSGTGHRVMLRASAAQFCSPSNGFHHLSEPRLDPYSKWLPCQITYSLRHSALDCIAFQRLGFSSSASPQHTDKETDQLSDNEKNIGTDIDSTKSTGDHATPEQTGDAEIDLSIEDLIKLVSEKEELLKQKHKEIEKMQDKLLRSYAETENVFDRTKREAENTKKFAVQNFAKSLLDVADNLGRAASVVKESFEKIDSSKDPVGAVSLLKTLLLGVEMTDKQLAEVFRKFGVEKYNPINEHFDPNRHNAVFQIPDASKSPDTVAVVLKPGYVLYDRVIRPAEVGVTQALKNEALADSDA